jgi:hypothetical protein
MAFARADKGGKIVAEAMVWRGMGQARRKDCAASALRRVALCYPHLGWFRRERRRQLRREGGGQAFGRRHSREIGAVVAVPSAVV